MSRYEGSRFPFIESLITQQEQFRHLFPVQSSLHFIPPTYHDSWPKLNIPGSSMAEQTTRLNSFIRDLDTKPVTNQSLTDVFAEIIDVVSGTTPQYIHPGFAQADRASLSAWVGGDAALASALRTIQTAWSDGMMSFNSDVARIRNYICMRT